ncbi:Ran GTPase-activating protein 1 [Polyplax serrata]|uniref:Ran GTPase-activating protein 1 n=1 Tax=Polyplax serrata TaxID=468196 RepID=A0AAN8PGR7_POLSC
MTDSKLNNLIAQLSKTSVHSNGVTFQGKSLKLNTEKDCDEVVAAINSCTNLEYLNLEGNTLGVDASKAIAKALETKGELKRALWKDMFTGRMKEEIPKALEYLGSGLTVAKSQLIELDLSDNAFGPIGVSGLAQLLSSPSCYQLQELKLNNNGLGISGSKMLAEALLRCHTNSAKEGRAFALKLLIIGRNRLENEGAAALAQVFETLGSLEEVSMPQNGIYHKGIKALSNAFKKNGNLRLLDLNDNTITKKGATHIANALPYLQKLEVVNFGDCLLRTDGAKVLADALAANHTNLKELHLSYNEIKLEGGLAIARAMANKPNLNKLNLNGNQFGSDGRTLVKEDLAINNKSAVLGTLSDDESCNDDESENDSNDEDEEEEDEDDEEEDNENEKEQNMKQNGLPFISTEFSGMPQKKSDNSDVVSGLFDNLSIKAKPLGSLKIFLDNPSVDTLLAVNENQINEYINSNQDYSVDFHVEAFIPLLVKLSSFVSTYNEGVRNLSKKMSENLYKNLFEWASEKNQISTVNNTLFVYLGLIKSEDKNFNINWDAKGSLLALNSAIEAKLVPEVTQETLKLLMQRKISNGNGEEIVIH